jgi:hypothetical protein
MFHRTPDPISISKTYVLKGRVAQDIVFCFRVSVDELMLLTAHGHRSGLVYAREPRTNEAFVCIIKLREQSSLNSLAERAVVPTNAP